MKKYKWNKDGNFTVTRGEVLQLGKKQLQSLYWFLKENDCEEINTDDTPIAVSRTDGKVEWDSTTKTVIRNILSSKGVKEFTVLSNDKTVAEQGCELQRLPVKELEAVTNFIKFKEYDGSYRHSDGSNELLINYKNGKYTYNRYILGEIISRTAELKVQEHSNTIADRIHRVERMLQSEMCLMNRHFHLVEADSDSSLHEKMERLLRLSHTLDLLGRYKDLNSLRLEAKMSSDFDNPISGELVETRYEEVKKEIVSLQREIDILTA